MSSTNKTTHYDLSQYVGSDKPTYLTDYNGDMAKIDAGIYGAKSLADVNETSIGDLTNLTTTAKTNLVGAVNEVDSDLGTLSNTVGNHTTAIADNTSAIGTLTNLTTTAKSNLVSAINEVDSNCDSNSNSIGTLSNLTTTVKTDLVSAVNEVDYNVGLFNLTNFTTVTPTLSTGSLNYGELKIATNSNGSIAKIYGSLSIARDGNDRCIITASSPLRPSSNITINCLVNRWAGNSKNYGMFDLNIATDGTITIDMYDGATSQNVDVYVLPCLLFIKDFGDTPTPQQ